MNGAVFTVSRRVSLLIEKTSSWRGGAITLTCTESYQRSSGCGVRKLNQTIAALGNINNRRGYIYTIRNTPVLQEEDEEWCVCVCTESNEGGLEDGGVNENED